ncbi:hypothetical protein [Niallia taxi]|nr:hypothetical protein [Niallia taxi]
MSRGVYERVTRCFPEAEDPTEMGPVPSDEDYEQLKRVGSNIKKRVTIG